MALPYPTIPQYPYHNATSALHPPQFVASPNSWLKIPDLQKTLHETWTDYTSTNTLHCSDPNLFWDISKTLLRGKIIAFTTLYKRKVLTSFWESSDCLQHAQAQLSSNNTPSDREFGSRPKQTSINGRKLKNAYINHIASNNIISLVKK